MCSAAARFWTRSGKTCRPDEDLRKPSAQSNFYRVMGIIWLLLLGVKVQPRKLHRDFLLNVSQILFLYFDPQDYESVS